MFAKSAIAMFGALRVKSIFQEHILIATNTVSMCIRETAVQSKESYKGLKLLESVGIFFSKTMRYF